MIVLFRGNNDPDRRPNIAVRLAQYIHPEEALFDLKYIFQTSIGLRASGELLFILHFIKKGTIHVLQLTSQIFQEYFFLEIIHIDDQYFKYYDVFVRNLKVQHDEDANTSKDTSTIEQRWGKFPSFLKRCQ